MSSEAATLAAPVPWHPGLDGEYPGQRSTLELRPGVTMVFCWCPLGPVDESPRVGFWIAQHPVNQRQWQAVMGINPSQAGHGDDFPVDSVSWNEATRFCEQAGLRLPTEVEWEYACRAGTQSDFAVGLGGDLNSQRANFDGDTPEGQGRESFKWLDRRGTTEEGSFPPNAWGLHDMHGQLWEWCQDGPQSGERGLRGGSWDYHGRYARSGYRNANVPGYRALYIGFRPCPGSTSGAAGGTAKRGKR